MGSSSKKPRAFYNPNVKRSKKQNKNADLVKQFTTLENRVKVEGDTKWIKNAKGMLTIRMKRAGLKPKVQK